MTPKTLKCEMEEMSRFMQNQQDQFAPTIRTATAAAMAETQASRATARFGDEGARHSVFAAMRTAARPQAAVGEDVRFARVAGVSRPHPTRPA